MSLSIIIAFLSGLLALVAAVFCWSPARVVSAISTMKLRANGWSINHSRVYSVLQRLDLPLDQLASFAPDLTSLFAIIAGVAVYSSLLLQRTVGVQDQQAAELSKELEWSKQRVVFLEEVNEQRKASRIDEKHQLEMDRQSKYFSDRLLRCSNQHQADQNEIRSLQQQLRTLQTAFSAPPSPSASSLDSPLEKPVNVFEPIVCLEAKKQLKRKPSFVPSNFRIKLIKAKKPAVDSVGLGIRAV